MSLFPTLLVEIECLLRATKNQEFTKALEPPSKQRLGKVPKEAVVVVRHNLGIRTFKSTAIDIFLLLRLSLLLWPISLLRAVCGGKFSSARYCQCLR